jgi:hypothetical protein
MLRETNAAAFEAARREYDAFMGGDTEDPVTAWIEYGRRLAEQSGPGRLLQIDASGRATPYRAPPAAGMLVLHIPDDPVTAVLTLAMPAEPAAAQRATHDLLVLRKLGLQADNG